MAILGTIALIVVVILGILVLRVKSDPMENEAVKKALADSTRATTAVSPDSPQASDSTPTKNLTPKT
jgi:uncharacterized membrane-anchored protein YhcB (DUF1043 family)